jgi:hypothetical protein
MNIDETLAALRELQDAGALSAMDVVLRNNPAAALVWYIQHEDSNRSSSSSSSVGRGVHDGTAA